MDMCPSIRDGAIMQISMVQSSCVTSHDEMNHHPDGDAIEVVGTECS